MDWEQPDKIAGVTKLNLIRSQLRVVNTQAMDCRQKQ